MAVTEIALLRLKTPLTSPTDIPPSILKDVSHAGRQQHSFSKYPVHLFHCTEDPQLIYLVGGWSSVAAHMEDWIPGPTNQELLKMLSDEVDVDWMFHVNVDPERVNRLLTGVDDNGVVAFGRHLISEEQGERFRRTFDENRSVLDEFIPGGAEQSVLGGWRADTGYDPSLANTGSDGDKPVEFVLFTVWPDVDRHMAFAETDGFKERYSKIREFVERFEVRHGKKVQLA